MNECLFRDYRYLFHQWASKEPWIRTRGEDGIMRTVETWREPTARERTAQLNLF
jgi:hypothetical protein